MQTKQLRELVDILQPFAESTDLAQGDTYITINYVVTLLMALQHNLVSQLATVRFHQPLVRELLRSLFDRFGGLYRHLSMPVLERIASTTTSADLHFDSPVFMMASAIDPEHGYRWLQWHPGTPAEKEKLKTKIFGELLNIMNNCRLTAVSPSTASSKAGEPSTSTATSEPAASQAIKKV